ncbi:MAG TPA: MotA/TolQ/ExbB proton channel family protein [Isosphaeraceae bacterium]|jgi:biopolymer transport protein ExbB/TolQ/uncharacterized protein YukE|nr:MotA/TolQ/ExbB proton channel family protein [Isosphaeraceae bacterium]
MAKSAQGMHWPGYAGTATMLVLALLFPVGLMIFDPTLMFERGWEQYVGTGIYFWAVVTLGRELVRIWRNEQAFEDAPLLLKRVNAALARVGPGDGFSATSVIADDDSRILPLRVRQLTSFLRESRSPSVTQLMEVNREGSGLDQEQMAGRFTLTRYILYLLPVIGFIGTVEGISKALMNISKVLPMVKNLDGFLTNLTSVTAALQIAFDSTLLALFLSAALMLVQTLVFRRSEDILARVDRWVVEHVLPHVGTDNPLAEQLTEVIGKQLDELGTKLARVLEPAVQALHEQTDKLGESLRVPIGQFTREMERLPDAFYSFKQGADTIGRIGADLEAIGSASESLRRGVATLGRIETLLGQMPSSHAELEEIKRGLERAGASIDTLAGSWSAAYERSSRATQEQLARSLTSLKDALEMLNVSMEQGNSLYRTIVKKLFDERHEPGVHRPESIKVA